MKDRERETQRDRETDRQRQIYTDKQTDNQRDKYEGRTKLTYLVAQKLPEIYTVIAFICIWKVA